MCIFVSFNYSNKMKTRILLIILITPSWIYAEVACSNSFLAEISINDPRRLIYSSYSQTNPAVLNDVNAVRFSTGTFSSEVNESNEKNLVGTMKDMV